MELRRLERKGQLGGIAQSVIFLGIAAIALILMIVISDELKNTDVVAKANAGSRTNETTSSVTEAAVNLGGAADPACAGASVTEVNNATGGDFLDGLILAGNYTVTGCTIALNNLGDTEYNNSDWNVTYSYTYGDVAFTAGNQTVVGLGTFADFWTIIVLAIVAAIVIGIVFSIFGQPQKR